MKRITLGLFVLLVTTFAQSTRAASVMFMGTGPNGLQADAKFTYAGTTLTVELRNTGANALVPSSVLTAIFFDVTGNQALTTDSATGNYIKLDNSGSATPVLGTNLGGEWAYQGGLSGAPGSAKYGLSSAGFDLFGPGDVFTPGQNNIAGPPAPDGVQLGIVPQGQPNSGMNGGMVGTNGQYFTKGLATFTFKDVNSFDVNNVHNVTFQYGTGLSEPSIVPTIVPVPLPAAAMMGGALMSGLSAIGVVRRRRMLAA